MSTDDGVAPVTIEGPDQSGGWPTGSLLGMLDEPDRFALLALGTALRFNSGRTIIREGDRGNHVVVLIQGCVKVFSGTRDGHTTLLAIRVGGDIIGEIAVLDGEPRSATVDAAVPTVGRLIERAVFEAYLQDRPRAGVVLRRTMAGKLRQANRFRVDLGGATVLVRLARVLYQLVLAYGTHDAKGVLVDVPLTQRELAALVGAADVSVQRALADMRRAGILTRHHRRLLILDLDRLAALALDPPARRRA